jgi:uncharacterized membrane protein YhaH (DUF805 family)
MGWAKPVARAVGRFLWIAGRVRRRTFWLTVVALDVAESYLPSWMHTPRSAAAAQLKQLVGVSLAWTLLAVIVKRLHDRDRSGLAVLLCMIPLVGWIFVLLGLVEVGFLAGTPGANRFGDDPGGVRGPGPSSSSHSPPAAPPVPAGATSPAPL